MLLEYTVAVSTTYNKQSVLGGVLMKLWETDGNQKLCTQLPIEKAELSAVGVQLSKIVL